MKTEYYMNFQGKKKPLQ